MTQESIGFRVAFKLRKVGNKFPKSSDQKRGSSKTGWSLRRFGELEFSERIGLMS